MRLKAATCFRLLAQSQQTGAVKTSNKEELEFKWQQVSKTSGYKKIILMCERLHLQMTLNVRYDLYLFSHQIRDQKELRELVASGLL